MVNGERVVSTNLRTNKANLSVGTRAYKMRLAQTPLECPVLEEFRQIAQFNYSVTCAEVIKMESILDYCLKRLESDILDNEDILKIEATGRKISACKTSDRGRERRQGRQGRND